MLSNSFDQECCNNRGCHTGLEDLFRFCVSRGNTAGISTAHKDAEESVLHVQPRRGHLHQIHRSVSYLFKVSQSNSDSICQEETNQTGTFPMNPQPETSTNPYLLIFLSLLRSVNKYICRFNHAIFQVEQLSAQLC